MEKMSGNAPMTTRLKLRPYREWPPCDGHARPAIWPALAKILERGTITVASDPIENKGQSEGGIYALPKCDSALFWRIAEPDLVGYVCLHCVEENAPQIPTEMLEGEILKLLGQSPMISADIKSTLNRPPLEMNVSEGTVDDVLRSLVSRGKVTQNDLIFRLTEKPLLSFFGPLSWILGTNRGNGPTDGENEISNSRSNQTDETERRTPEGDWVN